MPSKPGIFDVIFSGGILRPHGRAFYNVRRPIVHEFGDATFPMSLHLVQSAGN
jgi:hypothetical protein